MKEDDEMKLQRLAILVLPLLLAGIVFAQAGAAGAPAQNGAPAAQQGAQGSQPAQGAQPGQAAQAPPPGPQAKSKDEYDAFMQIQQAPDAATAENLAINFETKYPQSQLKSMAYNLVMRKYQEGNNVDKVLLTGRKAISFDPDDVQALLLVSGALANSTHDTDIDKDEKQTELKKDATHAIELLNAGALTKLGANQEQNNAALSLAYSALGTMDTHLHNWAAAEPNLRKATELSPDSDAVLWLNLALSLDNQQKYPDALNAATKAVQLASAPGYEEVLKTAQGEQARLKQLSGGATTPNATASGANSGAANSGATGAMPNSNSNAPNAQNKPQTPPKK
jgi:tetratricopeptide (TPR) repeat protein